MSQYGTKYETLGDCLKGGWQIYDRDTDGYLLRKKNPDDLWVLMRFEVKKHLREE